MKARLIAALAVLGAALPAMADAPAPSAMSRSALEAEVTASRPLIANGGVTTDRPAGCHAPENHQFDFWLGEWDVSPTGQKMVTAEADLTLTDQGCVILEDWRPFADAHGHGLFEYDKATGTWRHTFADATGVWAVMQGKLENGIMSLDIVSPPPSPKFPPNMRRRINYQRLDANTVRQWNERLDPVTHDWVIFEDLTFHRRSAG